MADIHRFNRLDKFPGIGLMRTYLKRPELLLLFVIINLIHNNNAETEIPAKQIIGIMDDAQNKLHKMAKTGRLVDYGTDEEIATLRSILNKAMLRTNAVGTCTSIYLRT